jgi:hypothetical protein
VKDSSAAETLRHYTALSNELHRRYLGDAEVLAAYERLIDLQMAYFLPRYDDLRDKPGYDAAIDFVVADLTGPGIADRDRDLEKVVPVMARTMPDRALPALATGMALNARILEINLGIEACLHQRLLDGDPITEREYCLASREVSDFEQFEELVGMTRRAGETLDHIVRLPMVRPLMRMMRGPARLAGFGDLQAFLEKGFHTFVAVEDVGVFLDAMEQRMSRVFHRVFVAPEHELADTPIRVA